MEEKVVKMLKEVKECLIDDIQVAIFGKYRFEDEDTTVEIVNRLLDRGVIKIIRNVKGNVVFSL